MALRQTVTKYKYSIAVLLSFVLVENIAWIIVYKVNVIGGSLHMYYNGGTYSKMYADVATNVIEESKSRGTSIQKCL